MSRSPSLRQWLTAQGGAAPFRNYMEAALYDPEFGYYSKNISTVGRGGDFSTSASLSSLLARAIAAWVRSEQCETDKPCHVIEIGPGSGQLHRDLRKALGWRGRFGIRSHLVERSPVLRKLQRHTLGLFGWGVSWHENPASALKAAGGQALIFSNELVDAFPVTLLQCDEKSWKEVWLELLPDGRLVESLRPAPVIATSLTVKDFAEGQRVEVHESHRQWQEEWLPEWHSGSMLTIDYGDTAKQLYCRRPHGTLRGYHKHERLEGLQLYRDPGHCDLTADVNFTDLQQWGEALGLATVSFEPQHKFIKRFIGPKKLGNSQAAIFLLDPHGPGGAFKCLVQRK